MSVSDTERITIPQSLRAVSDELYRRDAEATDERIKRLESALTRIHGTASMLRKWVYLGASDFLGVIHTLDDIIEYVDEAQPDGGAK